MRRVNPVCGDGFAQKNWIHPPAVVHRAHSHIERFVISFLYALRVRFVIGDKRARCERETYKRLLFRVFSNGFDRPTICEHEYLRELRQGKIAVLERRMNSLHIAVHEKTGRLVEGYPVCYSVGQSLDNCFYIESKVVYNIFFKPAAFFVLPERQIPVVERHERFDSVFMSSSTRLL